jgi:hypothetical protein
MTSRKVTSGDPSVPHLWFKGGRWLTIGDLFWCYLIHLINIFSKVPMGYNRSFTTQFMHIIINKISLYTGAQREIAVEIVNPW